MRDIVTVTGFSPPHCVTTPISAHTCICHSQRRGVGRRFDSAQGAGGHIARGGDLDGSERTGINKTQTVLFVYSNVSMTALCLSGAGYLEFSTSIVSFPRLFLSFPSLNIPFSPHDAALYLSAGVERPSRRFLRQGPQQSSAERRTAADRGCAAQHARRVWQHTAACRVPGIVSVCVCL